MGRTKRNGRILHIRSYGPSEIHEGKMINLEEVSHQHWSLIFLLGGGDSGSSLSWGQSVNHNFGSCELDENYLTEGSFSNKIGSGTSLEQPAVIKSYRFLQPPSATAAFEHHIFFPS